MERSLDRGREHPAAQSHHELVQPVLAQSRRGQVPAGELVVNAHDPGRRDVAGATDSARAADGQRRDEHRVAAREDAEPVYAAGRDADPLEVLEVAAGVLDALNGPFSRQRCKGRRLDDDLGELRNVVDEDRDRRVCSDGAVERQHARLVRGVVEGRRDQGCVSSGVGGRLHLCDGGRQLALRHPAQHRNPARRGLDRGVEHLAPGALVQRCGLSRRAEGEHALDASLDHVLHQARQACGVDFALARHRRSQGDKHPRQMIDLEHRAQPSASGKGTDRQLDFALKNC